MTDATNRTVVAACDGPVGRLRIRGSASVVTSVDWDEAAVADAPAGSAPARAARQLAAYFAGRRTRFDVALAPAGSAFQRRVWDALCAIPYGATRSYGDIAAAAGGTARAVGGACGANPIPILIPCHRVIAADGRLTGYSGRGGLETKRRLLELEAGAAERDLFAAAAACYDRARGPDNENEEEEAEP